MTRKSAFAPVTDARTRVLILGSLPGEASFAAQRYYAHPQNQFWRLVGGVTGFALADMDYPDRLAALAEARIGLWDTIATARREGSLDAAIREARAAPLADLAATLPNLRAIAFNGATSARVGRRQLDGLTALELIDLPSSSPAHAAMTLAQKQERWNLLRKFLG
jgi:hypoxanthine-DNA glycosylase